MKADTKIAPSEGKYLTQTAEVAVQDRIFAADWIALGSNDSVDNYREADEAEYQQWLKDYAEWEEKEMDKDIANIEREYQL